MTSAVKRSVPPLPLDRATAADLMQLATGDERGGAHIGAILVLGSTPGFSVAHARRAR